MSKVQYPKFTLGQKLTEEQISFFDKNGFIHFQGVASPEEIRAILNSTEAIQEKWICDDLKIVNGVPIKFGVDENGKKIVHRFPFTSQFSEPVHNFVNSDRVKCLTVLLPRAPELLKTKKMVSYSIIM